MSKKRSCYSESEMSLHEIIPCKKRLERQQLTRTHCNTNGFDARQVIVQKQKSRISDAREIINRKKQQQQQKLHHKEEDEISRKFMALSISPLKDLQQPQRRSIIARQSDGRAYKRPSNVDYDDMNQVEAEEERQRLFRGKSSKKASKQQAREPSNSFVLPDGSSAPFTSNHPDAVDLDVLHCALFGNSKSQ